MFSTVTFFKVQAINSNLGVKEPGYENDIDTFIAIKQYIVMQLSSTVYCNQAVYYKFCTAPIKR